MTNITGDEIASRAREGKARPTQVDLMWSEEDEARRGPKRAMSRRAVIAAAMAIADEGGVAAVSMAAVAKRLGFTSMALYRYVSSKEDLLATMVDAALGPPPESLRSIDTWPEICRQWTRSVRDHYLAHPWTLDVPISGPPVGPHQLLWLEYFLAGMRETGLSAHDALSTALLLSVFAQSNAKLERDMRVIANQSPEVAMSSYTALMGHLHASGNYPEVINVIEHGYFEDGGVEDDEFMFGVERIIDGVQALIDRR